jgi:ribosomal protein S12 methylthiotransferase
VLLARPRHHQLAGGCGRHLSDPPLLLLCLRGVCCACVRRQRRRDELVQHLQTTSEAFAASLVGQEVDVLINGTTEDGWLYGRTQWDAPDIDPIVFVSEPADSSVPAAEVGQMRRCRVSGNSMFDLEAYPVV